MKPGWMRGIAAMFRLTQAVLLCVACLLMVAACSENAVEPNPSATFKLGVLPNQDKSKMQESYAGLVRHLETATGLKIELRIPDDYAQLLDWFVNKEIDLAMFGGVTFVKANKQVGAVPLVMRDIDIRFHSVVLVKRDSGAASIADLKGKSFSFGSELSTSGHLMPRYYFQQLGIDPEQDFTTVNYSGAHDKTALLVQAGKAFAGVVNGSIVKEMFADGRLSPEKVKQLWESPIYADYVWAMQQDLFEINGTTIRDAFMALSRSIAADKAILDALGAGYYIPASVDDFQSLSRIMGQLDMLR